MLWEKTSGAAPRTMSRASGTPRKSGVSTSTAVPGLRLVDRRDHPGEVAGAAVGQVVAVDRGDHGVAEPHDRHRLGHVLGLLRDRRPACGTAGGHGAEAAAARADVAEDHEGGGAVLAPALVDVGAAGLLADRMEVQAVHELADLVVGGRGRETDPQPLGPGLPARGRRRVRTGTAELDRVSLIGR